MTRNRLGSEKSPYLKQHHLNPVHWYPWSEEAFAAARSQNKPIFLSIGYSTCYWCHVMEKESFERDEVAAVLNEHFVSIKVDREERPDIDQIYMDAVVALTGHGGWPMSVFLTPDLKPFWGGTYFPRAQFIQILAKLSEVWRTEPDKIASSAGEIADYLRSRIPPARGEISEEVCVRAVEMFRGTFDSQFGGFGRAPKFPPSRQLSFLLRYAGMKKDPFVLQMVTHTLDWMSGQGLFDHLGGGFHRYSTDAKWLVPHFEKMLYDNALLAVTYLEAFQMTDRPRYGEVARQTLEYVLRDMTHAEGGFFSAEDAGEVGTEGEFYVWAFSELADVLSEGQLTALVTAFDIDRDGNFEGKNILALRDSPSSAPEVREALDALTKIRGGRERPHRDEKILSGWNGLMVSAFAKGYQVLGETRYLQAAQNAMQFLLSALSADGRLLHRWCEGEAAISAFQEDYAFVIQGLLDLYESDFDTAWLRRAVSLQRECDDRFWDKEAGGYFFSDAPEVLVRRKDLIDGATPSGIGVTMLNLRRLGAYFGDEALRQKLSTCAAIYASILEKHPTAATSALIALIYDFAGPAVEIVLTGDSPRVRDAIKAVWRAPKWHRVLGWVRDASDVPLLRGRLGSPGDEALYLCREGACALPESGIGLETALQKWITS